MNRQPDAAAVPEKQVSVGKKEDTARLQDQLTGALIGLARSTDGNEWALKDSTVAIVVGKPFATLTNVNFGQRGSAASHRPGGRGEGATDSGLRCLCIPMRQK